MKDDLKIQVVVAASNFLYRLGVKTIISVIGIEPDLVEFENHNELTSHLEKAGQPDFLMINEDILPENYASLIDNIKHQYPDCKVMVMVDNPGRDGLISNYSVSLENQKEILEKFQEFFFEPEINENGENEKTNLSEREVDVLKSVALGFSNKEIADKLYISPNTVITHRKNITDKLGIKTIAGLTVYAMMNNLIQPEEVKQ